MAQTAHQAIPVAVLNPGGRDPEQTFPDGAGPPDPRRHPPVNYHAYAACTGGSFHRDARRIPAGTRAVLLLLRGNLKPALAALHALRRAGKVVAVSWKESGLGQVGAQLRSPAVIARFREICALADGALSSTPDLVPVYLGAGARHAEFIPTPYPLEDARWDFSIPLAERHGVFIGTREFKVLSRNHAAALWTARGLGAPVTVFNFEGRTAARCIQAFDLPAVTILSQRLPYPEYLGVVARHRLVLQCDRSTVPGQIAGDALLCRLPCVGGNGAVDTVAFPQPVDPSRLLHDDQACAAFIEASQRRASEALSFTVGARRLTEFFTRIAPPGGL